LKQHQQLADIRIHFVFFSHVWYSFPEKQFSENKSGFCEKLLPEKSAIYRSWVFGNHL
jgi:hypothetical protein